MARRMLLVGLLVGILAHDARAAGNHYWGDGGWGVLSVTCNLFYMPVKIVYAGLGTMTGGLAYVLTAGDSETAQKVWSPSVGGSYVITPAMLRGDEPIFFNGESYSGD